MPDTSTKYAHTQAYLTHLAQEYPSAAGETLDPANDLAEGTSGAKAKPELVRKVVRLLEEEDEDALKGLVEKTYGVDSSVRRAPLFCSPVLTGLSSILMLRNRSFWTSCTSTRMISKAYLSSSSAALSNGQYHAPRHEPPHIHSESSPTLPHQQFDPIRPAHLWQDRCPFVDPTRQSLHLSQLD